MKVYYFFLFLCKFLIGINFSIFAMELEHKQLEESKLFVNRQSDNESDMTAQEKSTLLDQATSNPQFIKLGRKWKLQKRIDLTQPIHLKLNKIDNSEGMQKIYSAQLKDGRTLHVVSTPQDGYNSTLSYSFKSSTNIVSFQPEPREYYAIIKAAYLNQEVKNSLPEQ